VDCLVAVRGPVHRADFPWPHHPRIRLRRAADPLGFTLAWMSIFGNSAIDQVLNHGMTALGMSAIDNPSMSLYLLLETYPWSKTVIAVTVFISFVFFVTSADSGTVVLSPSSQGR
jgi:choline/glycine/proline betaine transport protein